MQIIEATYMVTTPLFIAGADRAPELRISSIKGLLRFWYRATALPRLGNWQKVKEEEEKVFGSSDIGQGIFLLRIINGRYEVTSPPREWKAQGSAYLGYGLIGYNGRDRQVQTTRPYINPGTVFTVEVIFKHRASEQHIESVKKSLIALGLFGGLGARSRHGFGSLSLMSIKTNGQTEEEWGSSKDIAGLQEKIKNYVKGLGQFTGDLPDYTAFSRQSRISIVAVHDDPLFLLDIIGKEMLRYRSYGRKPRPGVPHSLPWREDAEQNFSDDHDLVIQFANTGSAYAHPRRVVFGLPHNYFFSSQQGLRVSVNAAKESTYKPERRSSPLFIHIHALSGRYVAVLSLLPAVFLPKDERISIKRGRMERNVEVKVDYGCIHKFLDRFPKRMEVTI